MSKLQGALLRTLLVGSSVCALAILGCSSARADVFLYNVSVPTDALNVNSADGPFSMLFELTDGSGTGDSDNTVTLTNFNVGPTSPIVLTDNEPIVYEIEGFTTPASPGGMLTFNLSTTNNTNIGSTPDEFSFFILDNTSAPISTTDQASSSLFTIDLGGSSPAITTYDGTDPYTEVVPTITPTVVTPEPSPISVLGLGAFATGGLMLMRRRSVVNG